MKTFNPMRKASIYLTVFLFILMNASISRSEVPKQETIMKEATYIPFEAKSGQDKELTAFLKEGATLVAQTEPNTLYWYALKKDDGSFGIFDFFSK